MRKIFTLLFAFVFVSAMQAQNYKVLNVNTTDGQTQTIKLSDIESLTVTEVGTVIPDVPDTHEYVDLGLPSGTLWATCNVGANAPEEYGDYFAWGETKPKETSDWSNYKWCDGTYMTLTKYCTNRSYGTVDNKTVLEPADDAATMNWGSNWRMPTSDELKELKTNCTWKRTTVNGVDGDLATGPNGNSIFLPEAGWIYEGSLTYAGYMGYYWSSSLDAASSCYQAFRLYIDRGSFYFDYVPRSNGHSVRPVRATK